jgi:hypothetical protein
MEGQMVDRKGDLMEGQMVDRKGDLMEGQMVDRKGDRKEGQRAAESKAASEGSQRSPLVALALLLLSGQESSREVEGRVNRPGHLVLALVLPKAASEGLLLKSWLSRLHRV